MYLEILNILSKGESMSIVIAACTKNYGLIMADTRAISKSNMTQKSVVVSENSLKLYPLSGCVCLGICGDRDISAPIAHSFPKSEDYDLEDCAKILSSKIKNVVLGEYPVHFFLLGKWKSAGSELRIISFSSIDGFTPYMTHPTELKPAYAMAIPTINKTERKHHEQKIKSIICSHKDVDELKTSLMAYVKEMAITETAINGDIIAVKIDERGIR